MGVGVWRGLGGLIDGCLIIMAYRLQESRLSDEVERLRERVHLSNNRLQELTYNDTKYVHKLVQFNLKAKDLLLQDRTAEAQVYLSEAERMLEYGASCGKTIDRSLIICTLHNQACCYYRESDLATAAKYIQGVIFNLRSHLGSTDHSPAPSLLEQRERREAAIARQIQLAAYYVKFCTVNSQNRCREGALDAGKQAVTHLNLIMRDIATDPPKITAAEVGEAAQVGRLLANVRVFRGQVRVGEVENYLLLAKHYLRKWNDGGGVRLSSGLEKMVNNYSISELIDLEPMEYLEEGEGLTSRLLIRQLLHLSMAYFTVSTEYRLMAEQLYKKLEQRQASEEFTKANIYHLLAILFMALNLPCDLLFMKQVVASYEHHFKTDLSAGPVDEDAVHKLSLRLLIDPYKHHTVTGHSLMDKVKLKSKSKGKKGSTDYEDSYAMSSKVCYRTNETKLSKERVKSKEKNKGKESKEKTFEMKGFHLTYKVKTDKDEKKEDKKQEKKGKGKRSSSKKNGVSGLSSCKKLKKILSDSIMESTKFLNTSKEKSTSIHKQTTPTKKRTNSKDSLYNSKELKSNDKKARKTNDEYRMSTAKCTIRRRVSSNSSETSGVSRDLANAQWKPERQARKTKKKEKVDKMEKQGMKRKKEAGSNGKHYYL